MNDDPIQQAIDNYITMERKAKAWDDYIEALRIAIAREHPGPCALSPAEVLKLLEGLMHSSKR